MAASHAASHAAGTAHTAPTAPRSLLDAALRQSDYWATVLRRTWRGTVVSSFLSPLLYVLAMGVLLGQYVEASPAELGGASSYLAFVAPGLLAAQTMQLVVGEVTYPVMGMVKWHRTYVGMLATPLDVRALVLAHLAFVAVRVVITSTVFVAVLAVAGVVDSVSGAVLALGVQLLLGTAFAAPVYAFSAGLADETPFSLVFRLGVVPLFLFSGAFFPVEQLGPVLEGLAAATPLWHGVELTRGATLGTLGEQGLLVVGGHAAYLLVLVVLGWLWAVRRLTRRLVH